MAKRNGNIIGPFILMIIGALLIYASKFVVTTCTGWNALNPVCLIAAAGSTIPATLIMIIGILMAVGGFLLLIKPIIQNIGGFF